jgi:lipopolysaccharide transport system ATP-binding protein
MGDVAREGRTVLFVSHNMGAITKFVASCVLIDEGRIVERGPTARVIASYLSSAFPSSGEITYDENPSKDAQIVRMVIRNGRGDVAATLDPAGPIVVETDFVVRRASRQMHVAFMIELPDGTAVCVSSTADVPAMPESWPPGVHRLQMALPGGLLNCGQYVVRPGIGRKDGIIVDYHATDGLTFELTEASEMGSLGFGTAPKPGVLGITPQYRIMSEDVEVVS